MMDTFRNFGQSWVAKILMILIALSFVLWGVSGYLFSGNSSSSAVATVDGQKISDTVFQKRMKDVQARYNHVFGAATAAKMMEEKSFGLDVLDGLINNMLLGAEARRLGLRVPDTALAKKIESIPAFQENGVFSKSHYQKLLAANGMTPAQFEGMLRASMRMEQLQVIPQAIATASNAEATRVWAWSQEYRDVSAVDIRDADFAAAAKPTSAEVAAYYHANVDQFQLPAQLQVQYVVLGPKDFVGKRLSPTNPASNVSAVAAEQSAASFNSQAENAFQAQVENFKDLLFSSPDGLAAVAKAYNLKIQESGMLTAGRVLAQGPFADARALDLAFSKAVLAGKNSTALRLANGDLLAVHLLHYTPGSTQPLSAVVRSITAKLSSAKAKKLAKNKAQALLAAARQAKDMNVLTDGGAHPLHTYLDITRRNGQGLDNAALAAAFTTPAPVDGIPSMDMVKTPSGYQILAITHVTAPSAAAINPKVAAQIRTSLEEQRSRLLSIAYLKDLREHAKVEINDAQLAQIAH